MEQENAIGADQGMRGETRAPWIAPEFKRLAAGSAETGAGPSDDDGTNFS